MESHKKMPRMIARAILTASLAALLAGCAEELTSEQLALDADPWSEPVWGPPAEGLRCRLSAARRKWAADETPVLRCDLQNSGRRTFAFWPAHKHQLCRIEVDAVWHRWQHPEKIESQIWPLPPGSGYRGITIQPDKGYGIDLKPGRHVIRVAFTLEDVRVTSNPFGIEITRAP